MLALLRTRRWISFTLLLMVLIVAFGVLSHWQWSRAEQRRLERVAIEERSQQSPVPVQSLLTPGFAPATDLEWRPVQAMGEFGPSALVRKRPLDGQNGFWVMSALRLDSGDWLWVNRGWIAASAGATQTPDVPPPPTGVVSIDGRIRPSQNGPDPQPADLPAGQVTDADVSILPAVDGPVYSAYIEAYSSQPNAQAGLTALQPPEIDDSRNVSYALQWILFASVGVVGWFFFLRREARGEDRDLQAVPADQAN